MNRKLLRASALALAGLYATTAQSRTSVFYTGQFVTWVAPTTGVYTITAYGAQGGSAIDDNSYFGFPVRPGGLGAEETGDFHLVAGQGLEIAVGEMGQSADLSDYIGAGGGGGGTFVLGDLGAGAVPILVAAGGGGAGTLQNESNGASEFTGASNSGEGGFGGSRTLDAMTFAGGGGGAGANSVGGAGGFGGGGGGGGDLADNLVGGVAGDRFSGAGGFGGGGGGAVYGGGGGGGYSGGDGGTVENPNADAFAYYGTEGHAGASLNIGDNPIAVIDAGASGGEVTIDFDPPAPPAVPEPATWALMLVGVSFVGGALRRRSPTPVSHTLQSGVN